MSLRELIILLLGLAIVGIILRGLYVALQARRGQLRMAIDKNIPSDIDLEALELAELPGGGARVVSRDTAEDESAVSASLDAANHRAESFNLGIEDEAVPVLMDSVEVGQVAAMDTPASNSTHDDERLAEEEWSEEWGDEWEEGEGDLETADVTTPEAVFESESATGESVSNSQYQESPSELASPDLFDDEPGEKQEPQIGDMRSYATSAVDAQGAADDEYDTQDDYSDYDDEAILAESHNEIDIDRAATERRAGEVETETIATEHPDDVLFDYDSEDQDSDYMDESDADELYVEAAVPHTDSGLHEQYENDSPAHAVYEEDEEEVDENTSVFLSEHEHIEQAPRAKAKADTYQQEYEGDHEEPYDDTEEYLDQEHEISDQSPPSQAADDEFAEFSMTAGERIGGNPGTEKQAGLFDQFDEPEHAAAAARGKTQKKSSLFAALKRRFTATDSEIAELSDSAPDQPVVAPELHAQPDLVEGAEDSFEENIAGDVESYDAAPVQTVEPDPHSLPVSESPLERAAFEAQSQFDDQGSAGWDRAEDSELESRWEDEHGEPENSEADNEFEHAEAEATRASHESRQIDWAGAAKSEPRQQSPVSQPSEIKQQSPAVQPSEVIVLNVVARGGREFRGDDLLEVLITSGLKFGEMNIFHQRFRGTNNGPVIFSVANILNPGTFDLNSIHEFSTVGVSLFLALPSPINNLEAFDQMLGVAQRIREELDGELKDDHRNVMTAQTIEHYRQRIRDFELRQLKAAGGRA